MTSLQFLLDYYDAPEFEDSRDETTQSWESIAAAMEAYHKYKLASDGDLADVSVMSDSDIGKGDIPLPDDYVEIKGVKFNSDSR